MNLPDLRVRHFFQIQGLRLRLTLLVARGQQNFVGDRLAGVKAQIVELPASSSTVQTLLATARPRAMTARDRLSTRARSTVRPNASPQWLGGIALGAAADRLLTGSATAALTAGSGEVASRTGALRRSQGMDCSISRALPELATPSSGACSARPRSRRAGGRVRPDVRPGLAYPQELPSPERVVPGRRGRRTLGASCGWCSGRPTSSRCSPATAPTRACWRSSSRCSAATSSRSSTRCTGRRRAPPRRVRLPPGHPLPPAARGLPRAGDLLRPDRHRDRPARRQRRDDRAAGQPSARRAGATADGRVMDRRSATRTCARSGSTPRQGRPLPRARRRRALAPRTRCTARAPTARPATAASTQRLRDRRRLRARRVGVPRRRALRARRAAAGPLRRPPHPPRAALRRLIDLVLGLEPSTQDKRGRRSSVVLGSS